MPKYLTAETYLISIPDMHCQQFLNLFIVIKKTSLFTKNGSNLKQNE